MNQKDSIEILEKLQTWCNDNKVDMNKIDFSHALKVYEELGHFDFSIKNSEKYEDAVSVLNYTSKNNSRCFDDEENIKGFMRDYSTNIVTDTKTGLMWQDEPYSEEELAAQLIDRNIGKVLTWDEANKYASKLRLGGYEDWRLPTLEELKSIVDDTKYNPAIIPIFQNAVSEGYWSSEVAPRPRSFQEALWSNGRTSSDECTDQAYSLDFLHGEAYNCRGNRVHYVRCVRDGQFVASKLEKTSSIADN